jgi:hypothetical protein
MRKLEAFGRRRFIGNLETREVHDRWHEDCEDCLLEGCLKNGQAVGFEPDALATALGDGFETCPICVDRTEPPRPPWAEDEPEAVS